MLNGRKWPKGDDVHWSVMLRYPTNSAYVALKHGVVTILLTLITMPSAFSSNADTTCRDSKAFLERKFESSGMLPTTDTLVTVIQDPDADHEERYLSLLVLGCSGDQDMAPVMLEALDDPDSDLRMGVVIGMRYLKSPEAVAPMVAIVRDNSENESVRRVASSVLSQIAADDPEVAAAIGEAARDTAQNLNVRLNHVLSLRAMTSAASVGELKTLLEDDNADMLAATAISLAHHDVEQSIPYLVDAVLSPYTQSWLKAKAARYLEHLVDQDFSFTAGRGFKTFHGGGAGGDELEPALAEIDDWWRANRYQFE